jgi:two-component system sensor histidine kinase/response regulator
MMTADEPIRVLLIEDNPGDARLIRRMLADAATANGQVHGYQVAWAERLATGLALLAQGETDIVLCDLSLPDSSGLETPRAVQNAAPELPVVVMTSQDDEENAVAAVQAGAQDYLVKGQVTAPMLSRSIRYARERKRTLAQLFHYSAALEQRNAELDAFAHTVAHDLKNPVAAVIGLAELLLDPQVQVAAAERTEILNDILQTGHTMHNIIQELMLLAQVNRAEVDLAPLSMLALIRSARYRLAQMSQEYQAEITLEAPERWPIAVGYGAWVEEVWVNYLSNALKYGGHPPQVTIGGELLDDGWARFWVRDQGPGIPAAMQPKLFVEFTQLSQARVQGHGLGLSIVRRIVEKLGGRAGVESQPGQGTTFYFVLPAAAQ